MKNELEAVFTKLTTVTPEQEDYTGEDGLLYCGKCRTPKEAYHTEETRALTEGMTSARRSATASGRSVWSVKPPSSAESTFKPWTS